MEALDFQCLSLLETNFFMSEKLIKNVKEAFKKANLYQSKITTEILKLDGMSGKKTRHFYNNLCSMEDAKYLEIGTWKGSTICSAMCENKMECICIDNWSEFGGPKKEFIKNFEKFKGENKAWFIEDDCWNVDKYLIITKFNIFMYDGNHSVESHRKALSYFKHYMEPAFIFIVDDWNSVRVRKGTLNSIVDNNFTVKYKKEIFTTRDGKHPKPNMSRGNGDWHNGICVFVLEK